MNSGWTQIQDKKMQYQIDLYSSPTYFTIKMLLIAAIGMVVALGNVIGLLRISPRY